MRSPALGKWFLVDLHVIADLLTKLSLPCPPRWVTTKLCIAHLVSIGFRGETFRCPLADVDEMGLQKVGMFRMLAG